MKYEKYLPIGTVVVLKDGEKPLMITGYNPMTDDEKSVTFDYSGCYYPEGILSPNEAYLFNHDMIEKVLFTGYDTEEGKEYTDKLKEYSEEELEVKIIDNDQNTTTNENELNPSNKTNIFDKLRVDN